MNRRPYPDINRALHQMERGRVPDPPRCPICEHFVNRHALEEGQRVCNLGAALVSCRDCAELWARSPAVAGLVNLGMLFRNGAGRRVLVEHPRKAGKSALVTAITDQAVKVGEHACTLPPLRPDQPLVLARAIRTCAAIPSQWNAWTVDGQYLYLRYRSGIGTVDAYDSPESEEWPQPPDGHIALFDTGEPYSGDMALAEFCDRTGLQLADGAEVIGE